jgi:hypothetical protein
LWFRVVFLAILYGSASFFAIFCFATLRFDTPRSIWFTIYTATTEHLFLPFGVFIYMALDLALSLSATFNTEKSMGKDSYFLSVSPVGKGPRLTTTTEYLCPISETVFFLLRMESSFYLLFMKAVGVVFNA